MAEHEISVDEIVSKNGEDINLPDFLAYENSHTAVDYEPEPTRLVEYGVVKTMVAGSIILPSTPIPITSNPFVYVTGLSYVPDFRVYLLSGTKYSPFAADMDFDVSTGNITVRLDYAADSYVLVVDGLGGTQSPVNMVISVNSYADMIAYGTPSTSTMFFVKHDEVNVDDYGDLNQAGFYIYINSSLEKISMRKDV